MDPLTVIIVLLLIGLAIFYKDTAAFITMFILLFIWSTMILVGLGVAWCVCFVIDGVKCLKRT